MPSNIAVLPSEAPGASRAAQSLVEAIARGREALAGAQRPDGSWESPTDLGPTGPAMHWIVEAQLGGTAAERATFIEGYSPIADEE